MNKREFFTSYFFKKGLRFLEKKEKGQKEIQDAHRLRDLESLAMRRRITEHALEKQGEIVRIYASIYRRYSKGLFDFQDRIRWINNLAGRPFEDSELELIMLEAYRLNFTKGYYLSQRKRTFKTWSKEETVALLEIDRDEQRIMLHFYEAAEKEQRIYQRIDGAARKREYRARKKLENAMIVSEADNENADFEDQETGQL